MRPVSHNKMSPQPGGITAVLGHFIARQTDVSFSGLKSPCLISQGDAINIKYGDAEHLCK